jgi:hypothetical protein
MNEARAFHESAMIFVGGDGDAMSAPVEACPDRDRRLSIAAGPDGDEDDMHA